MHRKRYFPADLESYPLHYAALRGDIKRIGELISTGQNCFRAIQDGETPLHVAIAERQTEAARLLFQEFRRQFQFVEERCGFEIPDNFWKEGCALIAIGDDQIRHVKQLEGRSVPIENLSEQLLIVTKSSIGDELTVLERGKINPEKLLELAEILLPNGMVSWNSTGPTGNCETLLMLAAYHGNIELLEQLIEQGADLSLAGPGKRTPFHAACDASQQRVIELLLSKYLDQFDSTALDENAQHGLHYILHRKNRDSFEMVAEKMVEFRVRKFGETASIAFNEIFKLENEDWPYCSIWIQLDAVFWDKSIETVLDRYQYDLRYQWKDVTVLIDMISYKKAKRFYTQAIRKNVELLNVRTSNGFTALHALICANERKLVKELYSIHPEVKTLFEGECAFSTLKTIMDKGLIEMMKFVLSNHSQFFQEHISKIEEQVIQECNSANYDDAFAILLKFLPILSASISEKQQQLYKFSMAAKHEFSDTYDQLLREFSATHDRIKVSGRTLDNFGNAVDNSFLHQAIQDNRTELVEQLIDSGVNLDQLDSDGRHAIHHVRCLEMLDILVEKHPKGSSLVNFKDRYGLTLLHTLCLSNADCKQELIIALLKYGANLNERTNDQSTVLHYTNDEDLFIFFTKTIESYGFPAVDLELRDIDGNTALHNHLRCSKVTISSIMLRASKSFVNFNNNGHSYLSYMVQFERQSFNTWLQPILDTYPDKTREMFEAEVKRSRNRASELFVKACAQMNTYLIEHFLRMDLDFNFRDGNGRVALLELVEGDEFPCSNIVFQLLEKRIDVNVRNKHGQNALMIVTNHIDKLEEPGFLTKLATKLIECGLTFEHVDDKGDSLMHYAFRIADFKLLRILLQNGAIISIYNKDGSRLYEVAAPCISYIFKGLQINDATDM